MLKDFMPEFGRDGLLNRGLRPDFRLAANDYLLK